MKRDTLTEYMMAHEGAITTICKLLLVQVSEGKTMILGVTLDRLVEFEETDPSEIVRLEREIEMVECEIIIKPRRIYRGRKDGRESFVALRADQLLTSDWHDPEGWKEKIFDINKPLKKQNENKAK